MHGDPGQKKRLFSNVYVTAPTVSVLPFAGTLAEAVIVPVGTGSAVRVNVGEPPAAVIERVWPADVPVLEKVPVAVAAA